ncbi:hypothetical protein J8273_7882 [Carpediemonas membranifera]|uniref:DRBM domain-containing protein n=1 Tax=Carpediemonas membranifera TaxID=201153 RepID=A0A8J6BUN5_9EUKA|nr:hypothetical protein J8273_7882 [Carpediemonas membranifera]|eukprot:KAG9390531.1 hypothetical protein J8273_7882 [Carpediemonas membranifera]
MHMVMQKIEREALPPHWLTTVENTLSKVLARKYPHCAGLNDAFFSFLYYHSLSACSLQPSLKLSGECLKLVGTIAATDGDSDAHVPESAIECPDETVEDPRIAMIARKVEKDSPRSARALLMGGRVRLIPATALAVKTAPPPPPSDLQYTPSLNYRGILTEYCQKHGGAPPSYETAPATPPPGERNWFKSTLTMTVGGNLVVLEAEAKSKKEAMSLVSFDAVTRHIAHKVPR